ncbi:hypothetical protein C805_02330 [Eubacterium sp. 14-2]|nr:hypothetical protein C805_02330 [Eubacterium sp. 14-2]
MILSGGVYPNMPPITRRGVYKTMRRRTTTKQLLEAITNNLLQVRKIECSYKSSNQINELSKEIFLDNLAFINESGVFANFIDWHYERDLSENDGYIIECGRYNPHSENIITVYLEVADNTTDEEINKILLFEETEE